VREHARVSRDVEVTFGRNWKMREPPWSSPRVQRLFMAAGKARPVWSGCEHPVFPAYHPLMERTLDSTLLHLVRSRMVDDYPTQIGQCLAVIREEDVWWRPDEHSNAFGNIMLHLIGSNRLYIGYGVGGLSVERDRAAEFSARGNRTRAAIVSAWDETVAVMREVLDALSPSQLMERTDRTGKSTTIASILLHASHHTAAHMGQLVWITKMRRPGALDELWIRTRDQLASARKS
jgi:uncharacterized damage-inducible protein DinB